VSKKKPLTHDEIQRIIDDYLLALDETKGRQVMVETAVAYRKGHFYIYPPGCSRDFVAISLKPAEIRAMTEKLVGGSP
jgi:hypothetical protein